MSARDIALIIDEPIAGHFYWILQLRDNGYGLPRAVDAAPGPMPTYGAALMAGIAALQRRTLRSAVVDGALWGSAPIARARAGSSAGPATVQ